MSAAAHTQLRPLNAIEMLRVSSDRQDVDRQEYDVAENRKEYNLNVLRTIRIKISGTKVMKHPDVKQLITDLSEPAVDAISLSALDRLFRPNDFNFEILQFMLVHKKTIVSAKEGIIEPWTPRGWATCMSGAQAAGTYLLDLKRNTGGGRAKTQKQKKMCQTTAPYGMVYVSKYERTPDGRNQCLIEDLTPTTIEGLSRKQVVAMVFEWRVKNRMRLGAIKTRLNKMGILSAGKKGQYEPGLWSRGTVRQLLENRKYVGEHREGGEMMECPKFVELADFEEAQAMAKSELEASNGRPATKHLLSGKLWCKCGRRHLTQSSNGGNSPGGSYICGRVDPRSRKRLCALPSRVKFSVIEAFVWNRIWRLLTEAEFLLENAQAYYDTLPSKTATMKLEKELARIQERIERTQEMVRLGTYDKNKGNAEILVDMREAEVVASQLRVAGSVMTLPEAYIVQAACERIANGHSPTTFDARRPILEYLVDLKIVYGDGVVEISGKVPVDADAAAKPRKGGPSGPALMCNRGVNGEYTSVRYIPFKIKERIAA
jgi:Resolvase, N terminal domain/Recombinase